MRKRGSPFLGAVSGFVLGIALDADLLLLGTVALDSALLLVLPPLLLVVGLVIGLVAPFRFGDRGGDAGGGGDGEQAIGSAPAEAGQAIGGDGPAEADVIGSGDADQQPRTPAE